MQTLRKKLFTLKRIPKTHMGCALVILGVCTMIEAPTFLDVAKEAAVVNICMAVCFFGLVLLAIATTHPHQP